MQLNPVDPVAGAPVDAASIDSPTWPSLDSADHIETDPGL